MSTAIAQQGKSTAVTTRRPSNFEITLQEYEPQLVAVLPPHIPIEKFKRVIITAVNQNPDLAAADRRSLFTSCVKAAQDGLLPDGREAALVIFNTKVKRDGKEIWISAVQYMPMIAGIRKRMRNTGEVLSADAAVVYKNDEFDYELGDNQFIKHKPTMGDPGPAIGAYAIIKLANGEIIRDVMGYARIEKARAVSKSKNGPAWTGWWDEMACKTVLRHAAKAAPTSAELERLLLTDDDDAGETRPTLTASLVPQRPRRDDFAPGLTNVADEDATLSFDIVTSDGEERSFDAADDAAQALRAHLEIAEKGSGEKGLIGIWETNGLLLTQLRERDHAEIADGLRQFYDGRLAVLDAIRKTKDSPAASGNTAGAADRNHSDASRQGDHDAAAPPASRQGAGQAPASPEQEQRQPAGDLLDKPLRDEAWFERESYEIAVPKKAGKDDWQRWEGLVRGTLAVVDNIDEKNKLFDDNHQQRMGLLQANAKAAANLDRAFAECESRLGRG